MSVTSTQSRLVRTALADAVRRLRELAGPVPAGLMATAHWTVADTLAHLSIITKMDVALVSTGVPAPAGIAELRAVTTVDTVSTMNSIILSHFTERDPAVLLDALEQDVHRLVLAVDSAGAPEVVPWLGDSRVPAEGLLAHLLNELDVHAWDIARASRRPWRSDPAEASLFFDLFLLGVTRAGYGHLLDRDGEPYPGRISVTFCSGYGEPATLALDRGVVQVVPLETRPDVRLTYDPVVLNRMLFGRVSRARAALTGKVRVSGRRPWLLPSFARTMRLPS
jgi:Mycothiol maleylpyruvate isomerase N-terminal domain